LHEAARNGQIEVAKALIAAGANVNLANKDGETPLYRATLYGHTEIVKLLEAAGAKK
jgi:cytohesin